MKKKSIAILISGSGSNLQAIIDAADSGAIDAEICAVISNRPDALGLQKAQAAGIDGYVIDHTDFADRESFDRALLHKLRELDPDLVVLAGFMRILSADFIASLKNRLLNIHPSLLPKFKGLNTHQRALDDGEKTHGASVHFVNNELDSGSVIIQAEVPVLADDDADSLAARVLEQEHTIYPLAISWFIDGKLHVEDDDAYFGENRITRPGLLKDGKLTEPT